MGVLNLYNECRRIFPVPSEKADREHIRLWGEVDSEFAYSWFESLANALNREMLNEVDARHYKELCEYLGAQFLSGDDKVKDCIDVAFTENLFWQVPASKAKNYWATLPKVLKDLYVGFHRRKPI